MAPRLVLFLLLLGGPASSTLAVAASSSAASLPPTPALATAASEPAAGGRWSTARARDWQRNHPWLVGSNFFPSTASNQLEMWQADTFDPETIERELGYAQRLGFTSMRVFLHDIPWREDEAGFSRRIDRFLSIADRHGISILFVLFDSCWDPFPKAGPQRPPKPHVHNSGWVQSPGREILVDEARHDELAAYVRGIVGRFGHDRRVVAWDLFNEPDNRNDPAYVSQEAENKAERAEALLRKAFVWARSVQPVQPLTSDLWTGDWTRDDTLRPIERLQISASDVISFHNYGDGQDMRRRAALLMRYRRPLLCTEYMARPTGSTFATILPYLRERGIGAWNWGFVSGKTQTIYPWDSWTKTYNGEPPLWFHDILRADGTAYDALETAVIRRQTADRRGH